jgi:hypothetical protein
MCIILGIMLPVFIAIGAAGLIATAIWHIALNSKKEKTKREKTREFILSVSGVNVENSQEAMERLSDMKALLPLVISEKEKNLEKEKIISALLSKFPEYRSGGISAASKIIAEYDRYTELLPSPCRSLSR